MNKYHVIKLIFTVLLTIFVIACAEKSISPTVQPKPESPKVDNNIEAESEVEPNQAVLEQYRKGIDAMQNGEFSQAERIFREFIRRNPRLAGAYTNLALIYFEKDNYEQALKMVNRAIELNGVQPQALNLRGQLMVINGDIHKAKNDYLKAIDVKPEYPNAQYNLALLYDIYLQEIALAVRHYEIYLSQSGQADEATQEWVEQLKRTLDNG